MFLENLLFLKLVGNVALWRGILSDLASGCGGDVGGGRAVVGACVDGQLGLGNGRKVVSSHNSSKNQRDCGIRGERATQHLGEWWRRCARSF